MDVNSKGKFIRVVASRKWGAAGREVFTLSGALPPDPVTFGAKVLRDWYLSQLRCLRNLSQK